MKTKRLFTLALAIIMLFSVLPISVSAEDEVIPMSECMGQLKSGNTYSISNAEEFLIFENNNTDIYSKVKIILTNDITVNEGKFTLDESKNLLYNGKAINETNMPVSFNPIDSFEGAFDGQGYTISGLYCSGEMAGLFEIASDATIRNLNIRNSAFISSEYDAGSFVGNCGSNTTIENCTSDAIVLGVTCVGGIAGECKEIKNCSFSGTVIGEYMVGGIAGLSESDIENCINHGEVIGEYYAGGLVGIAYSDIKNSGNLGAVYGQNCTGGVVGHLAGYAQNCYNKGEVHGFWDAGGFAGEATDGAKCCFNTGNVYGTYNIGGFIGSINIPHTSSMGKSGYLQYCYNAGEVYATEPGNFFGTSAGDFSLFSYCYFVGDDDDTANHYGDIEKSYQDYLDSVERDPLGMPTIVYDIGIYSISKERLRNEDSSSYPFKISGFVRDLCNENDGYPLPKSLHKKHVWGEYTDNKDGTMTAQCISENCGATDIKESNLKVWGQTNSDGSTLRFITCVDSLKYREVGFVITNADNPNQTIKRSSKVVYSKIIAGGKSVSAYDITGDENMKYILTFKITGLDGRQDTHFNVKPYVINLDGTTSYGAEKTFCPADMI